MSRTKHRRRLGSADRCDRCGAQAFTSVTLPAGSELLFCAHHARRYEDKLREVADVIHDESDHLTEAHVRPGALVHPSQR